MANLVSNPLVLVAAVGIVVFVSLLMVAVWYGKTKGRPDVLDRITEGDSLYKHLKKMSWYGKEKTQRLELGHGEDKGQVMRTQTILETNDEDMDDVEDDLEKMYKSGLIDEGQKDRIQNFVAGGTVPHRLIQFIPANKAMQQLAWKYLNKEWSDEMLIVPESKIRYEDADIVQIDRDVQLRPWGSDRRVHAPMTESGTDIVQAVNAQDSFNDALSTFKDLMEMLTHFNIKHAQDMDKLDKEAEIEDRNRPGVAGDVGQG